MGYPNGHAIRLEDQRRIKCVTCGAPACRCEHVPNAVSIAFYNYCAECWVKPGPLGTSPQTRAMTPTPGVEDEHSHREACEVRTRALRAEEGDDA